VTPISYEGDEISRLSRLVLEIYRGTDRRQTTDATIETEVYYANSVLTLM